MRSSCLLRSSLTSFLGGCTLVGMLPATALVAGCSDDGSVTKAMTGGNGGTAAETTGQGGTTSSSTSTSTSATSSAASTSGGGEGGAGGAPGPSLWGAPLVFAPTAKTFSVSAILENADPADLRAHVREPGDSSWSNAMKPEVRADDLAEWVFEGLTPNTRYDYRIVLRVDGEEEELYQGKALTRRPEGEAFSFAMISDSHIGSNLAYSNQGYPDVLTAISSEIGDANPDFLLNLGDLLDFHQYGFNVPPPNGQITRDAYLNYRFLLGDTTGKVAHFPVLGNWDGENGSYTPEAIGWSREQRLLYMPGPGPDTYAEGAGPGEDYYAFTWGDALFVVLNVMSYTTAEHLLSADEVPDDWTLGEDQLDWLETTLQEATSKWRFLFIHHTVGGAAGDAANSNYGRGGGQAAYVGEQATVHQLMLDYGVQIFFYGHDHVFTDMVVDGIHYSMPGSAGAPWKFTTEETGYTEYWPDSGWAEVDVSPDSVDVRFLGMGVGVLHEYSIEQ